jgi:hypothetical protein
VQYSLLKIRYNDLQGAYDLIEREIMYSDSCELYGNLGVICLLQWLYFIKQELDGDVDWDTIDFKGILSRLFPSA